MTFYITDFELVNTGSPSMPIQQFHSPPGEFIIGLSMHDAGAHVTSPQKLFTINVIRHFQAIAIYIGCRMAIQSHLQLGVSQSQVRTLLLDELGIREITRTFPQLDIQVKGWGSWV